MNHKMVHDLGGKLGLGAVDVNEKEVAFHESWEGREWGIARSVAPPGITNDWWRHVRELIAPDDYLNRPYFDTWAQTDLALFIEAGIISMDEVIAGHSLSSPEIDVDRLVLTNMAEALAADRQSACRFDSQQNAESQKYEVGQNIRTVASLEATHTRLPGYARDQCGRIHEYHGAHVLPDLSAQGITVYENLYSVEFLASGLWDDVDAKQDRVYLDLWERYLVERDD